MAWALPDTVYGGYSLHTLAGAERLIVAGHDPQVADRFQTVEPGIIRIA